MKFVSLHRWLRVCCLLLMVPASVTARTWTDVDGREVEAEYLSHDESEVTLQLDDGREATVPLGRLSPGDRELLRKGKPGGEGKPGPKRIGRAREEGGEPNWEAPWPEEIHFDEAPDIEVVEENEEEGIYVYTSRNYRFMCDARLSKSVVSTFADLFEATRLFCRALPLGLSGGVKYGGKYDILLFETTESYRLAGGKPDSAGIFIGDLNLVMVPLTSLGVRPVGSSYMRDRDKNDSTLVHELVHQLTPHAYLRADASAWFVEGIAEYCGVTEYRNGRFRVRGNFDEIVEYVTRYGEQQDGGRALGEELQAPRLKDFLSMDYSEFLDDDPNFNYGFGLVLTTYFLHLDGEGDAARIKEYLKVLRDPANRGDADRALGKLLDGRTWPELEEEISRSWRRKGIDIEFPDWE